MHRRSFISAMLGAAVGVMVAPHVALAGESAAEAGCVFAAPAKGVSLAHVEAAIIEYYIKNIEDVFSQTSSAYSSLTGYLPPGELNTRGKLIRI